MIDGLFLFRLLLSFLVGGIYIAAITRISELLGPKIGGVLSAIPTTGLVGMIFLGLTEGVGALPKAAPAMLVGFGVSLIFLTLYTHLRHRNMGTDLAIAISTSVWLVIMTGIGLLNISSVSLAFLLFLACFCLASLFFRSISETAAVNKPASTFALIARAVFAGAIVASTVLLARLISPVWGGAAAAFPALYLSSIVILEKQQGKTFTASVLKHISFGSLTLAVFAISIGLIARHHSLPVTIIASMLISLALTIGLLAYSEQSQP